MTENTLDKVRKLLRLGTSSNVNESAAAVAKAQAMMAEHQITEVMLVETTDAVDEETKDWQDPLDGVATLWRQRLAIIFTQANGCSGYTTHVDGQKRLLLIGTASNVQTVRYLYGYCLREIDRLTRANCAGEGRVYSNNFRLGCCDAIRTAITTEKERTITEMRQAVHGVNKDRQLMVLNTAIEKVNNQVTLATDYGRNVLKLARARGMACRGNWNARHAGRQAGAGIYSGTRRSAGAIEHTPKQIGRQ